MDTFAGVVRIVIGALFLAAGWSKWRAGHTRFLNAVLGYDLLRGRFAAIGARVLPPVEIAVGLALVMGVAPLYMAVFALALLTLATAAVTHSLVRGRDNHCGCVGFTWARVQTVQWSIVYRNWIAAALLLPVLTQQGGRFAAGHAAEGLSGSADTARALGEMAGAGLVACALLLAWLRWRSRFHASAGVFRQ